METNWIAIVLKDMAVFARDNGLDKTADHLLDAQETYFAERNAAVKDRLVSREIAVNL